jgi:hypothetical protein
VSLIIESIYTLFFLTSRTLRNHMRQDIGVLTHKMTDNLRDIDEGFTSLIRPSTARSKQSDSRERHTKEGSLYELQPFPKSLEQAHLSNIRPRTEC